MKAVLKNGIYWLEKPELMNLDEWAAENGFPVVLMVNSDRCDGFETIVAYVSSKEYSYLIGQIARNSEGRYCCMVTSFSNDSCNPVEVN